MIIVNGSEIRDKLLTSYKDEIETNNYKLKLAIINIGNNEASKIYVRNKKKICDLVGIECDIYSYDSIDKDELKNLINRLNNDKDVTGIMIELPLPVGFDKNEIYELINPNKDVDGLCKDSKVIPCTSLAVLEIFKYYDIDINKKIVLVGYSDLIGKPLDRYFKSKNIDVSVCNSKTNNLSDYTKNADIIITAVGKRNLITEDMVKDNSIIIDCAIVKEDNKLYGDVDFINVKDKCSLITPVPNGVGPITTAMVINNLLILNNIGDD